MGSMCEECHTPADAFTTKMKHAIKSGGFFFFFNTVVVKSTSKIPPLDMHLHCYVLPYAVIYDCQVHFPLNRLCLFVLSH